MNNIIVLIPHYNYIEGLIKSLKSIDIDEEVDVLVVDDGSKTTLNEEIIKDSFKAKGKIFFIKLKKNTGVTGALNSGLRSKIINDYKYIARLDCGDTCVKGRFKTQKSFLEKNNNIHLVGSLVNYVDLEGNYLYTLKSPITHEIIKKKLYINSMISHPTFFMRKELIDFIGYYPRKYKAAEDLAFLFKIKSKGYKLANVDLVLVNVEYNENSVSGKLRDEQLKSRIKLICDNFDYSRNAFWGLIRSCIIFVLPRWLLLKLKRLFL